MCLPNLFSPFIFSPGKTPVLVLIISCLNKYTNSWPNQLPSFLQNFFFPKCVSIGNSGRFTIPDLFLHMVPIVQSSTITPSPYKHFNKIISSMHFLSIWCLSNSIFPVTLGTQQKHLSYLPCLQSWQLTLSTTLL